MAEARGDRIGKDFFLNDPAKLDDPFAELAWLREHHPVLHHEGLGQWFVFCYDDVSALFHDPRLSADRMKGFVDAAPEAARAALREVAPFFASWLLMKDGADHARLRAALHAGFDLKAVEGLRAAIEAAAEDLLDRALAKDRNRLDACGDYAFLLPAYVLSEFLGVHSADRDRVVQWSVDFVDFFNVVPISAETTRRMVSSAKEMADYTRGLLAERRAQPREDFLGSLARAGLSEDEIVGNAMLLLLAGHVAVRNLIGNALWLLLTRPDQMAKLREDPALLHNAVEETLRFEPPVTLIPRVTLEPIELRGQIIPARQIVQLSIAAANRDPAQFPDPERFDIARKPSRHLGFAVGPHACLGALLAREEARISLEMLLRRLPGLRLDESRAITWYRNAGNRGPIALPLAF